MPRYATLIWGYFAADIFALITSCWCPLYFRWCWCFAAMMPLQPAMMPCWWLLYWHVTLRHWFTSWRHCISADTPCHYYADVRYITLMILSWPDADYADIFRCWCITLLLRDCFIDRFWALRMFADAFLWSMPLIFSLIISLLAAIDALILLCHHIIVIIITPCRFDYYRLRYHIFHIAHYAIFIFAMSLFFSWYFH